jgi:drug/metabolite transporter (DMT)-like permease
MQNINWYLTLSNTFTANTGLILFLGLVWLVVWFYSAWHCLHNCTGIDRLTWLTAIMGLPLMGVVFYWLRGADENRRVFKDIDAL